MLFRINQKLSEPFETMEGLRQGNPLATRKISADHSKTIYTRSARILAYADNLYVIGRNIATIKEIFEQLETETAVIE